MEAKKLYHSAKTGRDHAVPPKGYRTRFVDGVQMIVATDGSTSLEDGQLAEPIEELRGTLGDFELGPEFVQGALGQLVPAKPFVPKGASQTVETRFRRISTFQDTSDIPEADYSDPDAVAPVPGAAPSTAALRRWAVHLIGDTTEAAVVGASATEIMPGILMAVMDTKGASEAFLALLRIGSRLAMVPADNPEESAFLFGDITAAAAIGGNQTSVMVKLVR